jgi:hypothetical protein
VWKEKTKFDAESFKQRCPSRLKIYRCRAAAFEKRSYRAAIATAVVARQRQRRHEHLWF